MGILNITPDSFYDGGKHSGPAQVLAHAHKLVSQGADILDIGAYSTRPGATDISVEEEWNRLKPVIDLITENLPDTPLSIDTFRSEIARKSIQAGAHMINDISGGSLDDKMFDTIAELQVPYILMHSKGTPQTMSSLTDYNDLLGDIILDLSQKINQLRNKGVNDIIVDPGLGFAKTIDQNFEILKRLNEFSVFDEPLLIGLSRKSMIYKTLGLSAEDSLNGTSVLNTLAVQGGASILRVHDVKEAKEVVTLVEKTLTFGQ